MVSTKRSLKRTLQTRANDYLSCYESEKDLIHVLDSQVPILGNRHDYSNKSSNSSSAKNLMFKRKLSQNGSAKNLKLFQQPIYKTLLSRSE